MGFLMSALTGKSGILNGELGKIIKAAIGAYLRGESPQEFLKKLATTHPQLRGYDFDDLEGTAASIAEKQGKNIDELKVRVVDTVKTYL